VAEFGVLLAPAAIAEAVKTLNPPEEE